LSDPIAFWMNPYGKRWRVEPPPALRQTPGGILADEMVLNYKISEIFFVFYVYVVYENVVSTWMHISHTFPFFCSLFLLLSTTLSYEIGTR
jgi:hypothetical protein